MKIDRKRLSKKECINFTPFGSKNLAPDVPRRSQDAQDRPSSAKDPPKMPGFMASETPPRRPKTPPRRLKTAQDASRTAQDRLQDGPRSLETAKEAAKMRRDGLKRAKVIDFGIFWRPYWIQVGSIIAYWTHLLLKQLHS